MINGICGKILLVNLSTGEFKEETLPEEVYKQYLGGYGLATKLIYERSPKMVDPLGPDAIFGFFPGLLTGTVAPLSGRYMVAGKSPLTDMWGDANSGGSFGPEIKKCGYDAILIKGKADSPKYLAFIDGLKQLFDAKDLWGIDAIETEIKLVIKHPQAKVACIGPAGEKLSLISGIVNDKGRIAARSGLGAVMGSKKLKALVLKGNQKLEIANKDALTAATKNYNEGVKNATAGAIFMWKSQGTVWLNETSGKLGDTPIKNWGGTFAADFPADKMSKISGIELNKYKTKPYGCFSCSVQCGGTVKVPQANIEESHMPEYETCAAFGHMLLSNDIMSLFKVNDLCNRAGIDTISAGGTVAFAIECFENGILNSNDTGGLQLKWGNSEAILELVKKMVKREGIGDVLADGTKKASEKIKKGSEKYAMHSMGQEFGMHSPKYYKSLGYTYAFDPTPGRHTVGNLDMLAGGPIIKPNGLFEGFELPKKFKRPSDDRNIAFKTTSCLWQVTSSLGLCQFIYFYQKYPLFEAIKAVTGWDMKIDEIIEIGQRIQTLRQAFSLREGVDIAKNVMPARAVGEDYKADYKVYCEQMGWNPENGKPLNETFTKLKLQFASKDFY